MSSCHHAVKKKRNMRSQRNSIYNKILYILFLWVHIQRSPVKSLTAWWHYDQTVWCPVNRCRTGGLFEGPMRGRAGASCFFWQTSANSLQKPTTLSVNSHKRFQQNFHQTVSNFHQKGWKVDFFHQNFHHFHQKAPFSPLFLHQNGEKVDFFHFFFHQLSPEPIFLARERELTYLCTVSWDQRGPLTVQRSFIALIAPSRLLRPPAGKVTGQ